MTDIGKAKSSNASSGDRVSGRALPHLRRDEIEGLISDGNVVFIFRGLAIKANAWLSYHPGGEKAIMHMVGRDATDEVEA